MSASQVDTPGDPASDRIDGATPSSGDDRRPRSEPPRRQGAERMRLEARPRRLLYELSSIPPPRLDEITIVTGEDPPPSPPEPA